jgi:hypothetical protein
MNKPTTVETDLIAQLTIIRDALTDERASLVARIATIDEALGAQPGAAPKKATRAHGTGTLKAGVLAALEATPASTIREIALVCPEDSVKSIESTLQGLVASGQVTKDASTPRKFSLATPTTTPTTTKGNGASVQGVA